VEQSQCDTETSIEEVNNQEIASLAEELIEEQSEPIDVSELMLAADVGSEIEKREALIQVEKLVEKDMTLKFWHKEYLDFADRINTGFYVTALRTSVAPNLANLDQEMLPYGQEIVMVDFDKDIATNKLIEKGIFST
jgi:hypothetical protein